MSSTSSSILENMQRATEAMMEGYTKLDYDAIVGTRSEDFVYQFRPLSLGIPAVGNEQYKVHFFTNLKPVFTKFDLEATSLTYDVESRKSVFHGFTHSDSVIGPQSLELVLISTFNERGDKVVRVDEMFDSAKYTEFGAMLKEAKEKRGQ